MDRRPRSPLAAVALLAPLIIGSAGHAAAQERPDGPEALRPVTAFEQPRPGYEPRQLHIGSTILSPEITIEQVFDSNIFARSTDPQSDFIGVVTPRLALQSGPAHLAIDGEMYASRRQHVLHPDESTTSYGISAGGVYRGRTAQSLGFKAGFEHTFEPRGAPELDTDTGDDRPNEFNRLDVDLNYRYRPSRIGIELRETIRRFDFADAEESDRDRWTLRSAGRLSYLIVPRIDAFVEPYAEIREFDSRRDRAGRNRDEMVSGALFGNVVEITDVLHAEVGVGLFYSRYEDPFFSDSFGFATSSNLIWNITRRSSLIGSLSRRDASTSQSGDSRNIQTEASLRLEQEIRHDLLLGADVGVVHNDFSDTDRQRLTVSAGVSLEYFLNRHVRLFAAAREAVRWSDRSSDGYDRTQLSIGARLEY